MLFSHNVAAAAATLCEITLEISGIDIQMNGRMLTYRATGLEMTSFPRESHHTTVAHIERASRLLHKINGIFTEKATNSHFDGNLLCYFLFHDAIAMENIKSALEMSKNDHRSIFIPKYTALL